LLLELPQQLELLAAILVNGENIFFAFKWLEQRTAGQFAIGVRRLVQRVELGMNLEQALAAFASETSSPMVGEFCGKLVLSLERGTPLAGQLRTLAETASSQLQVQMLRQAGKNEIKMLIPLVFVILPVTVMVAVFPSIQLFQATL
jgi:tight adherence protein C